jgi:hypothetical protein
MNILELLQFCYNVNECSVLSLPVGTGRPRPPLSKKSIDFDHEIMDINEKK